MNVGSYLAELKNQLFKRFQIIRRRIERRPDAFPGLDYESFVTRLSVLEKIEVELLMAHWNEAVDKAHSQVTNRSCSTFIDCTTRFSSVQKI